MGKTLSTDIVSGAEKGRSVPHTPFNAKVGLLLWYLAAPEDSHYTSPRVGTMGERNDRTDQHSFDFNQHEVIAGRKEGGYGLMIRISEAVNFHAVGKIE